MADWIDAAFVAAHADVKGVDPTGAALVNATAAAAAYVQDARPDLGWAVEGFAPSAAVKLGAAMLAWRLYQRRSAPLGVATSNTGEPVEILRTDPDIERLLGVGSAGRFVFGAPARGPRTVTVPTSALNDGTVPE